MQGPLSTRETRLVFLRDGEKEKEEKRQNPVDLREKEKEKKPKPVDQKEEKPVACVAGNLNFVHVRDRNLDRRSLDRRVSTCGNPV